VNRRLVVTSESGKVALNDLRSFLRVCEENNLDIKKGAADYELGDDGKLRFSIALPGDTVVLAGGKRKIKIRKRDKRQQAIDAQLAQHREDKKNGVAEGYVPPVGRTTAPRKIKTPCPVCGFRKQVLTIGGVKTLKPHTVAGEACAGSGTQVGVARKGKKK
jgi:hypothetical protein